MLDLIAAAVLCTITDPRIPESSGLAVAGDRLYTVNDSGDTARFFVLDRRCAVRRVVDLPGVDAVDVEDLARTSDGAVWLADIGDNRARRGTVALHRWRDGGVSSYRLSYPDGPHDAEALVLTGGRAFVVTKSFSGRAGVYAGAPRAGATVRLERVGSLDLGIGEAVTGAALAPDGSRVALRTYTAAYEWPVTGGDVAAAWRGPPVRTELPATRQGEGIAYDDTGRTLVTTTEGLPGAVHEVPAAPLPAAVRPVRPSASGPPATPSALSAPDSAPSEGARPAASDGVRGRHRLFLAGLGFLVLVAAAAVLVRRPSRRRRTGHPG